MFIRTTGLLPGFLQILEDFPANGHVDKPYVLEQIILTTQVFLPAGRLHGSIGFCFLPHGNRRFFTKLRIFCGCLPGIFQVNMLKSIAAFKCTLHIMLKTVLCSTGKSSEASCIFKVILPADALSWGKSVCFFPPLLAGVDVDI